MHPQPQYKYLQTPLTPLPQYNTPHIIFSPYKTPIPHHFGPQPPVAGALTLAGLSSPISIRMEQEPPQMVVQLPASPFVWRTAGMMPKKRDIRVLPYLCIWSWHCNSSTPPYPGEVGSRRKSDTCHVFWIKGCGVFFTPICFDEFGVAWIKGVYYRKIDGKRDF